MKLNSLRTATQKRVIEATAKGELFVASDWDDKQQCWIGVIACRYKRNIIVLSVERAETQVEIKDWAREALVMKPWLRE